MQNPKLVLILLRLSIASVFLYAAIAATLQPEVWEGYLPVFVTSFLSLSEALILFSVFQVILSIWVLSGWQNEWSALAAAVTLAGIMITNVGDRDILFRDLAIFFAALALAAATYKKPH